MPAYPNFRFKWTDLGIVNKTAMEFWHQYEAGASGNDIVYDYSGHARTITSGAVDPVLQTNKVWGQPAWYFNGTTTDPLVWSGGVTLYHYFVVAAAEEAAFTTNRGLFSGATSGDVLVSNAAGTTFVDLGLTGGYQYLKSNVPYPQSNQQAPMNGRFELLECIAPASIAFDAIQVGRQRAFAGRIWKGWFAEQAGYSTILVPTERRKYLLYASLRYGVHSVNGSAIDLYFPSLDLLTGTDIVRGRHYAEPRDWGEVTEEYEYEDSNKDFNQFGSNPPKRWHIRYTNVSPALANFFDVFSDTVGISRPFFFKDKDGYVWSNVRIERGGYTRDLRTDTAPDRVVEFKLVGFNSVSNYEGF